MKRFICGAYPEYRYIRASYGYPKGNVRYTGLCRFDGLHDFSTRRQVLIMPTWREWIADEDYRLKEYEGTTEIPKTNFFVKWTEFLKSPKIKEISQKYKVKFVFFPHREMQRYMQFFPKSNDYLKVMCGKDIDIQVLLKESALMITDYSSVFFDFLYMKKPVIYYQFDYDMFRKGQYKEGYFNYKDNPFANSLDNVCDVFNEIERLINLNFAVNDGFLDAHKKYFPLYDNNNCKRVYDVVKNV